MKPKRSTCFKGNSAKSSILLEKATDYQRFFLLFFLQLPLFNCTNMARLSEVVITGKSNAWLLNLLHGLSLFTGACLPPRVNLSVFFLCRLPRTPGCRYDCLARGLMAPKEEDIKDVCHAPLLSETSGCELFSRMLSPRLIRTWNLYPSTVI